MRPRFFGEAYVALINVYLFILHHVFSSTLHIDEYVSQILPPPLNIVRLPTQIKSLLYGHTHSFEFINDDNYTEMLEFYQHQESTVWRTHIKNRNNIYWQNLTCVTVIYNIINNKNT